MEAAGSQDVTIDAVAYDNCFGEEVDNFGNPPVRTAEAGSLAWVNIDNKGGIEHIWVIVKQDEEVFEPFDIESHEDLILYDTGVVQPGDV